MSYADKVFKAMCEDILYNGTDTKGELVRPIWPDTNEKAYTIKKFGVVNRYDLRKEFPAGTFRPIGIKSCTEEVLWIYQKKSNKLSDMSLKIWDQWQDEYGTIGKAYGYQIGELYRHHKFHTEIISSKHMDTDKYTELRRIGNNYMNKNVDISFYPSASWTEVDTYKDDGTINIDLYLVLDQMDGVLWDLRHNPYSRRIITNTYNFNDLFEMSLYPCAYSMTYNVTKDDITGKLVLNAILNQRSQDVLAANQWNVCQYAVLLHMIAQVCDMIPGILLHCIADCHIYDRHIPIIKELINRREYPAPKLWLNPEIKNFYDFTKDDVKLLDYKHGEQIKNIPVAV